MSAVAHRVRGLHAPMPRGVIFVPHPVRTQEERLAARIEQARCEIARVLAEWNGAEHRTVPHEVSALVDAYCADYERRRDAILHNSLHKEQSIGDGTQAARTEEVKEKGSMRLSRRGEAGKRHAPSSDKDVDMSLTAEAETAMPPLMPQERLPRTHRRRRSTDTAHTQGTVLSYRFSRRRALPATLVWHYKTLNALIDTALEATLDAGLIETMRREIGTRTGHRKTALYYLDPKTYVKEKRKAKLAIAAALGLL